MLGSKAIASIMRRKKKRHQITEVIIQESAAIQSMIPKEDGTLSLLDPDGKEVAHTLHHSVAYLRDSGKPKCLRSIPIRSSRDRVGDNPWKNYDVIGFVDTNSIKEGDRILYVCSPSLLLWQDNSRRFADVHHVSLLVGYCDVGINPERIGWQDFIHRLNASDVLKASDAALLVVDSDKSAIDRINSGEEAIHDGCPLSTNFTLAYATSDGGSESWINKEMKRRDRVAARALERISNDSAFLSKVRSAGKLYVTNIFEADV